MSTITGGAIAGYVALLVLLVACIVWFRFAPELALGNDRWLRANRIGSVVIAVLVIGCWWWGMAFTTSGDYHAWNVKQGEVDRVAKRLIATDKGMAERYVVTINGQPYGIDDTRAALVQQGDEVSLRCKKDFQWGVPREAHGWACRWGKVPGF